MNNITESVVSVVAEYICVEPHEIKLTDNVRKDLGIDSLGLVQVSMGLEDIFGNIVELKDLGRVSDVQSLIDMVTERI